MIEHYKYWIRTAMGLEKIVLQEIGEKLSLGIYETKHKSVFLNLNENGIEEEILISLKTADDVYHFMGFCTGIDNTKLSAEKIPKFFNDNLLPFITKNAAIHIRVTVSFLGKRNFNRFGIENAINKILASQTNKTILSNENEDKWQEGEERIRVHIEDKTAYFGISLQDKPLHRRKWRINSYPAQLHPPIAAAMTIIANPAPELKIIDPFCGSGTILIESALQANDRQYFGFDIEEKALNIARKNSDLAGTNITFHNKDFYNIYKDFGEYFIISNPPWGEKHKIINKQEEIFLQKLLTIITHSKGAVIILPTKLIDKLKKKRINLTENFQTRIRGKLASVVRFN